MIPNLAMRNLVFEMPKINIRRVTAELILTVICVCILLWVFCADNDWLDRRFLPDFRIPQAHLVAGLQVVRVFAAAAALFLFIAVRPWVGRLVQRRSMLSLAGDCLPTFVAVVLAVVAAEFILRATVQPRLEWKEAVHEPRRVPDRVLGFDYVAGRTSYADVGGRRIQYVFDPAGLRVAGPGDRVDLGRPTIVFLGESVMGGFGLTWKESIPARVQALTGVQSADMSVEGYSIDQAYLRFRRRWSDVRRPVAVVSMFLPSAVYRTLEASHPGLRPGLSWRPGRDEWWLVRVLRRRVPYRSPEEVEAAIVVARQVFQATDRMARARGARHLVVVPVLSPEPEAERKLRRRVLEGSGVPYIVVPVDRRWRLPNNRHPNAWGAWVLAEAIARRLQASDARIAAPGAVSGVR